MVLTEPWKKNQWDCSGRVDGTGHMCVTLQSKQGLYSRRFETILVNFGYRLLILLLVI